MPPIPATARFSATLAAMLALLAKFCHLQRVPAPLPMLLWNRWRGIERQVSGLLARHRAGTLRRYPNRCPPTRGTPSRPPAASPFPRTAGWLPRLAPGLAEAAGQLDMLLNGADVPALLRDIPQLRRALRPMCRMLGVKLPPQHQQPSPTAAPPASPRPRHPTPPPPDTPRPRRRPVFAAPPEPAEKPA